MQLLRCVIVPYLLRARALAAAVHLLPDPYLHNQLAADVHPTHIHSDCEQRLMQFQRLFSEHS